MPLVMGRFSVWELLLAEFVAVWLHFAHNSAFRLELAEESGQNMSLRVPQACQPVHFASLSTQVSHDSITERSAAWRDPRSHPQ
jgi:hypothetical protein